MNHIVVVIEEQCAKKCHCNNWWVQSVETFFVPIRELLDSVHGFQEQCEA